MRPGPAGALTRAGVPGEPGALIAPEGSPGWHRGAAPAIAYRRWRAYSGTMIALNDRQLKAVMVAASSLPLEKRELFLERLAARWELHGRRFSDADLDRAVQLALQGLIQNSAA